MLLLGIFLLSVVALLFWEIPTKNETLLTMFLSFLGGSVSSAVAFYYGKEQFKQ